MYEHPGLPLPADARSQQRFMDTARRIMEVWLGRTRVALTARVVTFDDLIALGLVTASEADVYLQTLQDKRKTEGRTGPTGA